MSDEMRRACESKIAESVKTIESKFNIKMRTPKLSFDLRGRCAGRAVYATNTIKINLTLLKENYESMLSQTVPHEVAHHATKAIYGRDVRPHGREWQTVMNTLGRPAHRCHSYDTSNAQVRKRATYEVSCSCRVHTITSIVMRRIVRGAHYHCKRCGSGLTLKS